MKIELAVIGRGAVTPAGVGCEALFHGSTVPAAAAPLSRPDQPWPVLRVDWKHPALARWQREPRLRRASALSLFLVEAAEQALTGVNKADRSETGLAVAFSAGCIAYSHRFFEGIITGGQKTASPALFPETVFNSPMSHVVSVLGLNGAAYALVGDETAWIAALQTASIWLRQGRVKQVLVLGAEEFDPLVLDAYRSAGWLRRGKFTTGFLASEGAAGVLVRTRMSGGESASAPLIAGARQGLIYRSKREVSAAAEVLLQDVDFDVPVYRTAEHNWLGSLEGRATQGRTSIRTNPYLGEGFTASVAWNTLRALSLLKEHPRLALPVWGLNHQLGLLELEQQK